MTYRLFTAFAVLVVSVVAFADADDPGAVLQRGSFDFDDRQLAYFCAGQGTPTLILEAPSGISNEAGYANVLPQLAERGRVCAYERAFYGQSDPLVAGETQSVSDYAAELESFLALEDVEAPYVLIGFSYGGFVTRYFTAYDPTDVVGMVLIDSPHVRWLRAMKAEMTVDDWAKVEDIIQWFLVNRGHDVWRSQFEVEAAPALPRDLPVAVITRGLDHERMRQSGVTEAGFRVYNETHFKLAPEMLELTDRTVGFTAANSDHMIPDAEPEVVIGAVDRVLRMIRTKGGDISETAAE